MKEMNEYTAELHRRIDEKKSRIRKRRSVTAAICASAALLLGATAVITRVAVPHKQQVEINGITAGLAEEKGDRFVSVNAEWPVSSEGSSVYSDRIGFFGLFAVKHGDEVLFSLRENGPIYSMGEDGVKHVPGLLPLGIYFGSGYYEGGVYMPATSEVICGLVRAKGICRFDPETKTLKKVIDSKDEADLMTVDGSSLFYVACKERSAVIKLCDLKTGRIFRLAKLDSPRNEDWACYVKRIGACENGLAVLYGDSLFMVAYTGEATLIAEGVGDMSAEGDRIYAFTDPDGSLYEDPNGQRRGSSSGVTVYSSKDGAKLASAGLAGLILSRDAAGFTVYENKLVGVKDGAAFLVDPESGAEERLFDVPTDHVYAANAGGELLIVSALEQGEDRNDKAEVWLVSDGGVLRGKLPENIYSMRDIELIFDDIDSAEAELLYAPVPVLPGLSKAEITKISGWCSVITNALGESRNTSKGWFRIDAEYKGKKLVAYVNQEQEKNSRPGEGIRIGGESLLKLGFGPAMITEEELLGAETLPYVISESSDGGTVYMDLYVENGVPLGVYTWYEDGDGHAADVALSILRETSDHTATVRIESSELSYAELKELAEN